ncbi:MAG: ribosome silencing factor [Caldilineae bacterium]|nr:ribosome silencing factor [Chloroflexota bacterium]MCB9176629.1 ribosome silencing factor [Caldilineae bacterium]
MLDSTTLARAIFDAMGDKQAEDLVLLDIRPVSIITDYFVIGTAGSARQLRAVVESVEEQVRETLGVKPISIDGAFDSGWVLVDYGDVIVHVFAPDQRAFYQLEALWNEAPLVARMA